VLKSSPMRWPTQAQQAPPGAGSGVASSAPPIGLPQREDLYTAPTRASWWFDEGGRQQGQATHRYRLYSAGGVRGFHLLRRDRVLQPVGDRRDPAQPGCTTVASPHHSRPAVRSPTSAPRVRGPGSHGREPEVIEVSRSSRP
jgi:hypothetical protein